MITFSISTRRIQTAPTSPIDGPFARAAAAAVAAVVERRCIVDSQPVARTVTVRGALAQRRPLQRRALVKTDAPRRARSTQAETSVSYCT